MPVTAFQPLCTFVSFVVKSAFRLQLPSLLPKATPFNQDLTLKNK